MYLGTVHNGTIKYRVERMAKEPAQPQKASQDVTPASQPTPYARVGEDGVFYNGPQVSDVPTGPVRVVVFGRQADKIVQSPEMKSLLKTNGRGWILLPVASDQNWGAASTQLVHALMDEHALAMIALDRDAAHLAEQLALKTFVPVIALSEDRKLTSTNVPWIFRMPASTSPAQALRLVEDAVAKGGANPEKLRDALASGKSIEGVAFLSTGEPKKQ
jgi:phosphoribosylcarboxyaminoimidazole (NCAIR) mutase